MSNLERSLSFTVTLHAAIILETSNRRDKQMESLTNLLVGRTFELVENNAGHAVSATIMRFGKSTESCTATYSGPNVTTGHAILRSDEMLYHAIDSNGKLSAGRAKVSITKTPVEVAEMRLNWTWLTGDKTSGISIWRECDAK